jgi:hypothetical protein
MSKSSILRYLGNFLLMLGYQVMLWGNFKFGLAIKFIGGLLGIPFAIKLKLWDVLFGFLKPSGGVNMTLLGFLLP